MAAARQPHRAPGAAAATGPGIHCRRHCIAAICRCRCLPIADSHYCRIALCCALPFAALHSRRPTAVRTIPLLRRAGPACNSLWHCRLFWPFALPSPQLFQALIAGHRAWAGHHRALPHCRYAAPGFSLSPGLIVRRAVNGPAGPLLLLPLFPFLFGISGFITGRCHLAISTLYYCIIIIIYYGLCQLLLLLHLLISALLFPFIRCLLLLLLLLQLLPLLLQFNYHLRIPALLLSFYFILFYRGRPAGNRQLPGAAVPLSYSPGICSPGSPGRRHRALPGLAIRARRLRRRPAALRAGVIGFHSGPYYYYYYCRCQHY